MVDIVDDTDATLAELTTDRLIYMRDLPFSDPKWEGCPFPLLDVKDAIRDELEKRGYDPKKKAPDMISDSEEFQDASQAAAEKIRNMILEVGQSKGQNDCTALTGALCAVAELAIQLKPKDIDEAEALERICSTILFYGTQTMLGAAIDYDRPEKSN